MFEQFSDNSEYLCCWDSYLPHQGTTDSTVKLWTDRAWVDAWEWIWDWFWSVTMYSNGTLPLPLPLDAQCVYTLSPISYILSLFILSISYCTEERDNFQIIFPESYPESCFQLKCPCYVTLVFYVPLKLLFLSSAAFIPLSCSCFVFISVYILYWTKLYV